MGEIVKVAFEIVAGCGFIKSDDEKIMLSVNSSKGNVLSTIFGSMMNTADEYQKYQSNLTLEAAKCVHYKTLGTNTLMVFRDTHLIYVAWCRDDNAHDVICGLTKSLKSKEPYYECKFDKDATAKELETLAKYRFTVTKWSETFKSDDHPIAPRKVPPIWITFSTTDNISHPASAESYNTIMRLAAHVSLADTEVAAKFEDFAALSDAISYLEKQELEFAVSVSV